MKSDDTNHKNYKKNMKSDRIWVWISFEFQ